MSDDDKTAPREKESEKGAPVAENGFVSAPVSVQAPSPVVSSNVMNAVVPPVPVYEKNVSTRVREVKTTGALVPSLSLLSRDTDVVLSPVPSKVVHVDVDLSHLAREAILKSAYSNNFGKMTSIMIRAVDAYKAKTGKVVSFSPTTLMKGLNTGRIQQKEASRQAKERVKAMKEREMEQKTQEAGPSSSSAPAPPRQGRT